MDTSPEDLATLQQLSRLQEASSPQDLSEADQMQTSPDLSESDTAQQQQQQKEQNAPENSESDAQKPPRGSQHLSEAGKTRVRILYNDAKMSPADIRRVTGYSRGQISRALFTPEGPRKRKGPKSKMSSEEEQQLLEFVDKNRTMTWAAIAESVFDGKFSVHMVRHVLRRHGFQRDGSASKAKPRVTVKKASAK
ncbi:hypothetical protein GGS20DRAFT_12111 [Poronia punctata]|nr:hypothetical protein GGS20DRAFT_12111 [Poronia punctata]